MLVDPVDGHFEKQFSPWPVRFYGLKKSEQGFVLAFKAQPENYGYDANEMEKWIRENI